MLRWEGDSMFFNDQLVGWVNCIFVAMKHERRPGFRACIVHNDRIAKSVLENWAMKVYRCKEVAQ